MFTEQHVNRQLVSWTIPSSAFTSLEPLFIVILAPLIVRLWKKMSERNQEPLPLIKIGVGLLLGGCGFVIFALGTHHAAYSQQNISMLWIITGNLVLGLGVLCIMPTLISAITQYAPKAIKSTMMGLLYLSLAFSGYFASLIGKLTIKNGQYSTPMVYFDVYSKICLLTIVVAIVVLFIGYALKRRSASTLLAEKESVRMQESNT